MPRISDGDDAGARRIGSSFSGLRGRKVGERMATGAMFKAKIG